MTCQFRVVPFLPAKPDNLYRPQHQIKVYDILGKELVTLLNESRSPGTYEIDFDAAKYNLTSGMYFYSIKAGAFNQVRKMILIK